MSALRLDSTRARRSIQHRVRRVEGRLADTFARAVERAPGNSLERAMGTPLRRVVLEGIFRQMPAFLNRKAAAGLDATIRWEFTDAGDGRRETYSVRIADGRARVGRGQRGPEPRVTIILRADQFVRLVTGNMDPMQAYFSGQVKLKGDIMLAAKLPTLFRVPAGGAPHR